MNITKNIRGACAIEYAFLSALLLVAGVASVNAVGSKVSDMLTSAAHAITPAAPASSDRTYVLTYAGDGTTRYWAGYKNKGDDYEASEAFVDYDLDGGSVYLTSSDLGTACWELDGSRNKKQRKSFSGVISATSVLQSETPFDFNYIPVTFRVENAGRKSPGRFGDEGLTRITAIAEIKCRVAS